MILSDTSSFTFLDLHIYNNAKIWRIVLVLILVIDFRPVKFHCFWGNDCLRYDEFPGSPGKNEKKSNIASLRNY